MRSSASPTSGETARSGNDAPVHEAVLHGSACDAVPRARDPALRRPDSHWDSNALGHSNRNAHRNTYGNSNRYGYRDAHGHHDRGMWPAVPRYANSDGNADQHADCHADRDSDSDSDINANSDTRFVRLPLAADNDLHDRQRSESGQ